MASDQSIIDDLVNNPAEALSVELKGWLDPAVLPDAARIVKACVALRNTGGGFLVLGFTDTGDPVNDTAPTDPAARYHGDIIQALVAKHVSQSFEVLVRWGVRGGNRFPVLEIPSGVRSPVAIRSPLRDGDGTPLLVEHRVFVRSLQANNRPSTTEATWRDWPAMVDVCFDSREADIGRFIRRHLTGITPDIVRLFADQMVPSGSSQPVQLVAEERAAVIAEEGRIRFSEIVTERSLQLPPHGWWDVGAVIDGDVPPHAATEDFLRLLFSNNPRYSGWPVWIDSRPFSAESHPYVYADMWEALVISTSVFPKIDFWRLDPKGTFYHRRAHQDDFASESDIPPQKYVDFGLVILRVAEIIAVGLKFATAMGADPEKCDLVFSFTWQSLRGRELASWANRNRDIDDGRVSRQDTVSTVIRVPLETPDSAVGPHVQAATAPLFRAFSGTEFIPRIYEDLTSQALERR